MGMFDELWCYYPLPEPGAAGITFQTKDTPHQALARYAIRADGELWSETITVAVRAGSIDAQQGVLVDKPRLWRPAFFTGEIVFYGGKDGVSFTFVAEFEDGQLTNLASLAQDPPIELTGDGWRWLVDRMGNPPPRTPKFVEAMRDYEEMKAAQARDDARAGAVTAVLSEVLQATPAAASDSFGLECFGPASSIASQMTCGEPLGELPRILDEELARWWGEDRAAEFAPLDTLAQRMIDAVAAAGLDWCSESACGASDRNATRSLLHVRPNLRRWAVCIAPDDSNLTLGRLYPVLDERAGMLRIIDDHGSERLAPRSAFQTVVLGIDASRAIAKALVFPRT